MKGFHRILEKELVFFLKKTTNFCTATIFDIHLIKQTKTALRSVAQFICDCQRRSGQQKKERPSEAWVSPCSIPQLCWQSIN